MDQENLAVLADHLHRVDPVVLVILAVLDLLLLQGLQFPHLVRLGQLVLGLPVALVVLVDRKVLVKETVCL